MKYKNKAATINLHMAADMNKNTRAVYSNTRRIGLAESSRLLLLHILQNEYGMADDQQTGTQAIEQERRYLRERIGRKPGTAMILEHMLAGLYEDAREQLRLLAGHPERLPPPGCPYTLARLLEEPMAAVA